MEVFFKGIFVIPVKRKACCLRKQKVTILPGDITVHTRIDPVTLVTAARRNFNKWQEFNDQR